MKRTITYPKEALIALTYRCNARCHMCNTWMYPTRSEDEVTPMDLASLPDDLVFCNITGGEPFLRTDIGAFVELMSRKAKRIVVSTNGYFTERIVELSRQFPSLGIRVSIEGLAEVNDELRGLPGGFERGLDTLRQLQSLGRKDIGFGITLSDRNIMDVMGLYALGEKMQMEFATACVHNSYYFHKFDNRVTRIEDFRAELQKLMGCLLKSRRLKNWYRAYFNHGLLNFAQGGKRALPCEAARSVFFIDPFAHVMACNGMDMPMGDLKKDSFIDIWQSSRAREVCRAAAACEKQCWMIGTVSPAIKRHPVAPTRWVIRNKLRIALGKEIV